MASSIPNNVKKKFLNGNINLLTDTIKVALFTSSYTPNIDTDQFFSDISANESTGTGYTTGGKQLTTPTITVDTTNDRAVFDADDASWMSSNIGDARYALIYKDTGTASTSPLIAVVDLGATKSSAGDTFTLQWDANGIFYVA